MQVFLDQVEESVIETNVCVVGAGPAGISLAMELVEGGTNVVLLEGGTDKCKSPGCGRSAR